jgi:hypothetical protein
LCMDNKHQLFGIADRQPAIRSVRENTHILLFPEGTNQKTHDK